jgi:starch synthase (maltosyl-transferring)
MNQTRIVIEAVSPAVDNGRFPVKAVVGDRLEVSVDIWKDSHELLSAAVLWRRRELTDLRPFADPLPVDLTKKWREAPLETRWEANDRWVGHIELDSLGPWLYTIVAWTDVFGTWREELKKKIAASHDIHSELLEGMAIVEQTLAVTRGTDREALAGMLEGMRRAADDRRRTQLALDARLLELMELHDPRRDAQAYDRELPVWVDRERARFGAWYEIFPRSQGRDANRGATLREAEQRLPAIAEMNFDVLYLTPVHPIGTTARKGRNNSARRQPDDPGSPWAIGGPAGGHDALHPELGTFADFDHYVASARKLGLEVALDFAVQCSPDHPWVKSHPDWFAHRPDGTIKHAENPPKKYEDIYPLDFETEDREGLYQALLDVVRFWVGHGIKIFRVDNPHTKPQSFWEWLICEVHQEDPEVLFLAEAFTRPKRMKRLAKLGFSQSYTYFTWRNTRAELEEYARELFQSDVRYFLRPNFFANTPDILHEILQHGGRPAFIMRLVLAATLSPSYGIYSGFELCENKPLRPGSEEYLDSEKYQIRVRDWGAPGNIIPIVTQLNRIRRAHRALAHADNLRLLDSTNPQIIAYAKSAPAASDHIVCVVNLDPYQVQEGLVRLPDEVRAGTSAYEVRDLLTGTVYRWQGESNYVRLDPHVLPAHILHILR